MTTIQNNFVTNQNTTSADSNASTDSDATQITSSNVGALHHAQLSPGEMAQTDSLQTPSVGVRSNALNTPPPVLQATQPAKATDLQSAQRRLSDLTSNFAHPTTGAMILASEQGLSPQVHLAGGSKGGDSSSITQAALSPDTSSTSASSDGSQNASQSSGNLPNIVSTDLNDAQNNPVSDAAASLINSASELPLEGKCKGHVDRKIEANKAQDIAKATGLNNSQALTLLRAMNQNNTANGTTVANNLTSNEQTILASAIETLQQLKNNGQGNSLAAAQMKASLASVSATLDKTGNNALGGSLLNSYRTDMNQLVTDVQQVGNGATGSLSAASNPSSNADLVGPQLVDPNDP